MSAHEPQARTSGGLASVTTRVGHAVDRLTSSARLAQEARALRAHVQLTPRTDMLQMGTPGYGYWVVPESMLGEDSVCYLAGTGTDITFDISLIARFGCTVHAFDPVPEAAAFVARAARFEPRFVFHPWGLWSEDAELAFHAPVEEGYVSHSATDMHETPVAFRAPVRSVASIMRELGHDRVDLLKISAEGAEYEILDGVASEGLTPRVISVEFAQPAPKGKAASAYDKLRARGYALCAATIRPRTCKMTFVHSA